jgi:hypothetical protein
MESGERLLLIAYLSTSPIPQGFFLFGLLSFVHL